MAVHKVKAVCIDNKLLDKSEGRRVGIDGLDG